ncbi:MAG TPA: methionine aminotransferase [Cytophagales bacterium]|nr:methionine aminotransferase [Cytophagales bacterium]
MSDKHTTIFTVMSALAQEHGAINLAQGFPGFASDRKLIDLAYSHMIDGANQYAPMAGVLPLRQAISDKIFKQHQVRYEAADEICVTAGATEAVHVALQSVISPGDEVILLEPAFDLYVAAIVQAGGIPKYVKLTFPGFEIDWNQVEAVVTSKTKALVINSPHNPTGTIISKKDIRQLEALALRHDLWVISDEVYEHMIYDGEHHESVIQSTVLRDRSFVVFSLGKTFHVTGWRLGYCVAPKHLMDAFKAVHQYVTFSAATPLQLACATYLQEEHTYLDLAPFFQQKRDYFLEQMQDSGFEPLPCKGTYFQLMSYAGRYTEDDVTLAKRLTVEMKVASIPVSVFHHDKQQQQVLRFCFAKDHIDLKTAARNLGNF